MERLNMMGSFGGIQFNTALKLLTFYKGEKMRFGGIQFNTALKHVQSDLSSALCFGGIQFNTALKPLGMRV